MSTSLDRTLASSDVIIHDRLPAGFSRTDRTFELPPVLYKATVACYLGFLAVMSLGLGNPGLVIPMAICVTFIVLGFALPLVWVRMAPDNPGHPKSWARLVREGANVHTGPVCARDVAVQMLILPVLILLWGVATVVIAAAVS